MLKSKIDKPYEKRSDLRICQGDIYRAFPFKVIIEQDKALELMFPYIVVISQDCDLDHGYKQEGLGFQSSIAKCNQFLPNILFLPAFTKDSIKSGKHLEGIYKITQEYINSDRMGLILDNKNERYHYLLGYPDFQVPELITDFKMYFTLPTNIVFPLLNKYYLATVNELLREKLNQRFSFYLSRIGTPDKFVG